MDDNVEKLGRDLGAPKREGSILFGLPMPDGDDGAGSPDGPGRREFRAGEAALAGLVIGDADLKVAPGEAGRANFENPATEGLSGRAIPPIRDKAAGEPGRTALACKRVICAGGAATSLCSRLLGPATRRRRSSNCVLSFGDNGPTSDHTFSPTRV